MSIFPNFPNFLNFCRFYFIFLNFSIFFYFWNSRYIFYSFNLVLFRYDSKMCGWLRHDSNHRPENSVRIRTIQLHQNVLSSVGHLCPRRFSRFMLRFDPDFGPRCALFRTLSDVLHSIETIIEQWTCPQK